MENAPPPDAIRISRILCALDLVSDNTAIFQTAAELANQYGAQLVFCHAVPGTEAIPERLMDCELRRHLIAQAREQLQTMTASAGVSATIIIDSGDVARVIDAAARTSGADLVVIGRSRQHGLGRLRTHSYAIIRESSCPVLSI
jgi:nucleotide-binding universal stress UspA family protein